MSYLLFVTRVPAFAYQAGSIRVDNSVVACAADTCTPAEEAAIFTAVNAAGPGSDAVDGDTVSYTGTTIDAGNETIGNAQLNIAANRVWAIVFSVKIQ